MSTKSKRKNTNPESEETKSKSAKTAGKPSSIRLHIVLKAPPERVYKAALDPAALAKWLPPNGFTCTVHELNAKVGGSFKMSFTNFSTGKSHAFGGKYSVLEPNNRIVYTDTFDDPTMPGTMTTSWTITKVSCGTEVEITQEGIPAQIPPEQCYLGWQESLDLLKRVVEPDIPDQGLE